MESRNNQDRLGLPDNVEETQEDLAVSKEEKPKNKGLEFWNTATTEFVDLPSEGKLYASNNPLSTGKVEIKTMTAYHEDILANREYMREGILFDKFIDSILMEDIDPKVILEGDRLAIMVAARRTAYGPTFEATVACPACRAANKIEVDMSDNEESNLHTQKGFLDDNIKDVFNVSLNEDGHLVFELPVSKVVVESKVSDGVLERQLFQYGAFKRKQGFGQLGNVDHMKKIVVSVNGETDRTKLDNFFTNMPARDAKYWRDIYKMCQPTVKLLARQQCAGDYCTNLIEEEVGLTPEFFWPRSRLK